MRRDVVGSTARVFELIHVESGFSRQDRVILKKIERYCKNVANLALCGDPQAPYPQAREGGNLMSMGFEGSIFAARRCARCRGRGDRRSPSARLGASPSALTESIPLSHAQRALWLHHASAPDSSVRNSSVAFRGDSTRHAALSAQFARPASSDASSQDLRRRGSRCNAS